MLCQRIPGLVIDCHVFVCSDDYLADALTAFKRRITLHCLSLDNPRWLPFAARYFLLKDEAAGSANLALFRRRFGRSRVSIWINCSDFIGD